MNDMIKYAGYICLFGIGTMAFYEDVVTRHYKIKTDKWRFGFAKRIMVMSDLHNTNFGYRQHKLINMALKYKPNYILFAGDMIDERSNPECTYELLSAISIVSPTWYVLGNHEYRTEHILQIIKRVEACGSHVLRNQIVRMYSKNCPLLIAGKDDIEKSRYPLLDSDNRARIALSSIKSFNKTTFQILLTHRPEEYFRYKKFGFDLTIAGHTHGGQWRMPPLINGVYSSDQGLFPAYAGGLYQDPKGSTLIVSRGLDKERKIPRIFNPPEILVIDILGSAGKCS